MSTPANTGQQRRREAQRKAEDRREQERLAAQGRRRRRLLLAGGATVVVVAAVVAVILSVGSPSNSTSGSPSASSSTIATAPFVPGTGVQLSDSDPPWALPTDARPYIAAAGLQVLGQEALAVHYHAHVDIIVNGATQTIPAGIGFLIQNGQEKGITVLHTHDTSGVIHIESPTDSPYRLGQVFTEWGVRLGRGQLGGLTDTGGKTLRLYVDGHEFTGDPSTVVLRSHQELVLWYGPSTESPSVPATYQFPAGE